MIRLAGENLSSSGFEKVCTLLNRSALISRAVNAAIRAAKYPTAMEHAALSKVIRSILMPVCTIKLTFPLITPVSTISDI